MNAEDAARWSEAARMAFGHRAPELFGCLYDTTSVMGRVVSLDLDAWRAPSGGWQDLFAASPWQLLDLPLWLLADLSAPGQRAALEGDLLDAGALMAVAILINETWAGAEGGDSPAAQILSGALVSRATWMLARLTGPADLSALSSAAWEAHAAALAAPTLWGSVWPPGPVPALDEAAIVAWGQRFAPLKTVAAAALHAAGHPALVPQVLPEKDGVAPTVVPEVKVQELLTVRLVALQVWSFDGPELLLVVVKDVRAENAPLVVPQTARTCHW